MIVFLRGFEVCLPRIIDPTCFSFDCKGSRGAILVDKILGQQRAVVKELDDQFSYLNTVAGTAILANTKVGLVLDVPGILSESLGG